MPTQIPLARWRQWKHRFQCAVLGEASTLVFTRAFIHMLSKYLLCRRGSLLTPKCTTETSYSGWCHPGTLSGVCAVTLHQRLSGLIESFFETLRPDEFWWVWSFQLWVHWVLSRCSESCSVLTAHTAATRFVSGWHLDLPAAIDSQIKTN